MNEKFPTFPDDPVKEKNVKGKVTFAKVFLVFSSPDPLWIHHLRRDFWSATTSRAEIVHSPQRMEVQREVLSVWRYNESVVRCCVVCQFVCAFGLSVRQSACLVLFRSGVPFVFSEFLDLTFVSREEELRAPYRRRRGLRIAIISD